MKNLKEIIALEITKLCICLLCPSCAQKKKDGPTNPWVSAGMVSMIKINKINQIKNFFILIIISAIKGFCINIFFKYPIFDFTIMHFKASFMRRMQRY